MKDNDNVNNPSHYTHAKFEVIDVIEAFKLNYHIGNVIKYILRHEHKGNCIEDLKKARWYLDRYITSLSDKELQEPERIQENSDSFYENRINDLEEQVEMIRSFLAI